MRTYVRALENQEIDQDGQGRLPGYSEAVVRHFDAPEALDTRFYEVHAKSALNAVPEASRMPFRWTVNPYRGCSHACVYCQRAIRRSSWPTARPASSPYPPGERIYGTVRRGAYRRYVATEVLDHWMVARPPIGSRSRTARS